MKKFALLIYTDDTLIDALPEAQFDSSMRDCIAHADEMRNEGRPLDSQQLEGADRARSMRVRNGRRTVVDGPFAETKELLAGFNIIEAEDLDEAVRMAEEFPWAEFGCIEVREVRDMNAVRERVGGPAAASVQGRSP
jgi:hypothetical protein